MKKSIYVLGLGVAMMATSCESINNLLEVKIDTDFEVSIPLETETTPLKSGNQLYAFRGEKVFDPISNQDFVDVQNKIKEIAVNGIEFKFTSFDLDEIKVFNTTIEVIDSKGTSVKFSFHDFTIVGGAAFVDYLLEEGWKEEMSRFFTSGSVTVKVDGLVNKPGAAMEAITTIASTIFAGL